MNPQSISFVPQDDPYWRLSNTMRNIQDVQEQHGERIRNLERRQDEDGRMKNLWGPASPFPHAIGTPNHGPIQPPATADFPGFDDDTQSASMVRSLQLDADDEPRRMGATSRANSVRFDESANQGANQWSGHHSNRASGDFLQRTSSGLSGLGGHPLFERSGSHKSEGKQSSASHSLAPGRSNSFGLGLDTLQNTDDHPGVAPFLSILGSPPAVVRCWLNTRFTATNMLYAAVCTGSYKSLLDRNLISEMGYDDLVREDISGQRKIKLPVYFPEAKSVGASSRASSPAPSLPNLHVDFTVLDQGSPPADGAGKRIRIFIGSDTLRAHNGDVLFSSDSLVVYDGERNRLTIPFARPEDESVFKGLQTTDVRGRTAVAAPPPAFAEPLSDLQILPNGLLEHRRNTRPESSERRSTDSDVLSKSEASLRHPSMRDSSAGSGSERHSEEHAMDAGKAALAQINTTQTHDSTSSQVDSPPLTSTSRTSSSPAIWSNWRREAGSSTSGSEWPSSSRLGRSAGGIKVLKPTRQPSRSSGPSSAIVAGSASTSSTAPVGSPTTSSLRSSDLSKKRVSNPLEGLGDSKQQALRDSAPNETKDDKAGGTGKPTSKVNPIGGASAFSWMNSGSK